MSLKTEAQIVLTDIENFILKIEHKLPSEIDVVCKKANALIIKVEILLNNSTVTDFTKLVPETEPAREAILSILTTLGKVFSTVDASLQPGLIAIAGANVSAAMHGVGTSPTAYLTPYVTVSANSVLKGN